MECDILYHHFDEEKVHQIKRIITDIFDHDRYDMTILIVKKGNCFVNAITSVAKQKVTVCSDKLIGCPEFVRLLKGKKHLCVFDDAVRYGRRIKGVLESINNICIKNHIDIDIDVKVIAKNITYDPSLLLPVKITDFDQAFICDNLYELRKSAVSLIECMYDAKYPYVVGAPKTHIKKIDSSDMIDFVSYNQFEKLEHGDALELLNRSKISLYERYLNQDQLTDESMFGKALGRFIANASMEVYMYHNESVSMQLVSRAALLRVSEDNIDKLVYHFLDLSNLKRGCEHWCDIMCSSPELKFEFLNYIYSVLIAFEVVGTDLFQFDIRDIKNHYGTGCFKALEDIINEMYHNFRKVKQSLIQIHELLEYDLEQDMKMDHTVDKLYHTFIEEVFSNMNQEDITVQNLFRIQSGADKYLNENSMKSEEILEIRVPVLLEYFKEYYDEITIRKELVHHQIGGKVTMFVKSSRANSKIYVEKLVKTGESGVGALSFNKKITMEDIKNAFEDSINRFFEDIKNAFEDSINRFFEAYNKFKLPSSEKTTVVGESMRQLQINNLSEQWKHMNEDQLSQLHNLEPETLTRIWTIFCSEKANHKITIDYDKENSTGYEENISYTEDMIFDLNEEWTLLIRVKTSINQMNGDNKKNISMLLPEFAWCIREYNDDKYPDFEHKMTELLRNDILDVKTYSS